MKTIVLGDSLEALIDHRGKTPKKLGADFTAQGVPVASAILVGDGRLNLDQARHASEDLWRRWMSTPTRAGDVLLTSEAPLGRLARVPTDAPLVLGQRLFGLRGKPGVLDNGYLYYVLQTDAVQADLGGRATGTTVLGIRQSALRNVLIPAPPIWEQRAIAEVLESLDDKIAANARLASTAIKLAGSMYSLAIVGAPDEPMSGVLSPVLGGTPARARDDYWSGTRPWASAKDVTGAWFGMVFDTDEQITDLAVDETKAKPLPSGGVILTARGTVGAVARVTQPTSFNQSCYGFVPGLVPSTCLYFAILAATEQAKQMAHGSVFDTITKRTFGHLSVPSLTREQWRTIEARIGPLFSLSESLGRESVRLAETRDALLPGLMSGRIRVKDVERAVEEAV